ncbi:MAG: hypothetical protein KAJ10_08265, partial [Thermodesulfovibrionia bacterium]|nr:hypothetical protein [Thermodesulfovibrionia bacterium]
MKRNLFILTLVLALSVTLAMIVWAAIPPPSVDQDVGIEDTMFNNLVEADCRDCHGPNPPPGIPTDTTYLPDRHHLNVGTAVTVGNCQETSSTCDNDTECLDFCDLDTATTCTVDGDCDKRCSVTTATVCLVDGDCPATETCDASQTCDVLPVDTTYLPDRHHLNMNTTIPVGDCQETPNACQLNSDCYDFCDLDPATACTVDANCAGGATGPCVIGENYCVNDSEAPNATLTSPASGLYECLTCHTLVWDPVTMTSQFSPFRDCTLCHMVDFQPDHPDRAEGLNVHHAQPEARAGNCNYCHGDLVDRGWFDLDSDCDALNLCGDGTTVCAVDADCAGIPDGALDTKVAPWIPTYQPSLVTPWPSGKNFGRCDETCDGSTIGSCSVTTTTDCTTDGDCPATETCEGEVAGTCSVSTDPCFVLADCAGSDTQCVTDANCSIAGEVCNLDLDGGGGG